MPFTCDSMSAYDACLLESTMILAPETSARCSVQPRDAIEVLRVPLLVARRQPRPKQQGQVSISVDGESQRDSLIRVELAPSAESHLPDALPEGTGLEGLSAPAELVVTQPPVPKVDGLADVENPWELAQRPLQQGGPAASLATDVDDPEPVVVRLGGTGWR